MAWIRFDPMQYLRDRVKRLVFVCRYGGLTLTEALHCDVRFLELYASALAEILEEEKPRGL